MTSSKVPIRRPLATTRWILLAAILPACSLPPLATWHAPPAVSLTGLEVGTASWYGPGFHGGRTSSGERYDQYALTAAHPTLPLGSKLMVTNLENGRAVEVRVNDRGPFVDGRIIDLSYSAARALDLVGPGTARVSLERLDDGREVGSHVLYAAQAAAFQDGARALALKDALAKEFETVYVAPYRTARSLYYRVRLGPFTRREMALARARHLNRKGLRAIIVEEVVR